MKKLLSTMLVASMFAGVLAGCGSSSSSTTESTTTESTTTETGAAAFKIGGHGPLTGGAAIYGNAAKNGAQIAVDEINAMGGIQFELSYEDDEHDAEKAISAYNTLKDWGMQVSLGGVTSTPATTTATEHFADRIFALTPSASATTVTADNDNVFQLCFADPNQGTASADYIANNGLATKVAVIYQNDDVYSSGIYDTFKVEAEAQGLEIVSVTTFTEDSQTDFSVQIGEAKSAGAELLFLPMYYTPASLIMTQCMSASYSPLMFGVDGMDGILTVEGFDTSLAEGVMLLTPFNADAEDDATVSFVAKYNELFGETPNQFAADGYDCVYAYKEALEACGATPDMGAEEICELLVEAFTGGFSFDGLTGDAMTWAATGEVSKDPKGMVIQDGAYVGM